MATRIPYHLLGSRVRHSYDTSYNNGIMAASAGTTLAETSAVEDLAKLNSESDDDIWYPGSDTGNDDLHVVTLYLPRAYDLTGYYTAWGGNVSASSLRYSFYEIWVYRAGAWEHWAEMGVPPGSMAGWRSGVNSPSTKTGVTQVTCGVTMDSTAVWCLGLHLYGAPTVPFDDRLTLWDPALDQRLADDIDFGTLAASGVATSTFRVKNPTPAAADNVTISASDLTGAMADGMEFSIGGGAYAASLNIGTIAAGAISDVITVRRTVSGAPTLGPAAALIQAAAA